MTTIKDLYTLLNSMTQNADAAKAAGETIAQAAHLLALFWSKLHAMETLLNRADLPDTPAVETLRAIQYTAALPPEKEVMNLVDWLILLEVPAQTREKAIETLNTRLNQHGFVVQHTGLIKANKIVNLNPNA